MYGEGCCIKCKGLFTKTGRNHKTCPACANDRPKIGDEIACWTCGKPFTRRGKRHTFCDACSADRQRKRAYDHQVRTGYIKNPGVGTGHAQGRGQEHHSWKTGIGTYKQHRASACERCGAVDNLCAHHRDHDRKNNSPDNIETLCKRCHQIEHGAGACLPKGEELAALKRVQASKAKRDSAGRFIK